MWTHFNNFPTNLSDSNYSASLCSNTVNINNIILRFFLVFPHPQPFLILLMTFFLFMFLFFVLLILLIKILSYFNLSTWSFY